MVSQLKNLIICVPIFAWASLGISAEIIEKPALIIAPMDWALGYFQSSHGEGSHITKTQIDLNHDGVDELFLGWNAAGGRNGMPFLVFRKSETGYLFLGDLFMRGDFRGFKVLPLSEDGRLRFAQYWAHGGCEGTIAISTHDGTMFSVVKSEKICAGDSGTEQGNMRFKEVFGE